MRAYPIDSPQAATRLLAMALVADGHFAPCELQTLDRLGAPKRLGLSPQGMKSVIDTFCWELMHLRRGEWQGLASLTPDLRARLFNEVRNPRVQSEVWRLCEAIVQSDGRVSEGEAAVMDAMAQTWQMWPAETDRVAA